MASHQRISSPLLTVAGMDNEGLGLALDLRCYFYGGWGKQEDTTADRMVMSREGAGTTGGKVEISLGLIGGQIG